MCGELVRCMCSGVAGGLAFVARVGLLACVGGLACIVCECVCLWWFPALVPACLYLPKHRIDLLHADIGYNHMKLGR